MKQGQSQRGEETPLAKRDVLTHIVSNECVGPGFFRMEIELEGAEAVFRPGQFFELRIFPESLDPLLRRPFAPSELKPGGLAFVYAVVGRGTRAMTDLHAGDPVSVLYPLGRGFTLPEEKDARAVLAGGGSAAPSLLVLALTLARRGTAVHAAYGATTREALVVAEDLRAIASEVRLATDDGSEGLQGTAVDAAAGILDELQGASPIRVYGAGPEAMLSALARLAGARGRPCEVSIEARMACGFGACMGCVVRVKDASRPEGFVYQRVCQDGPVFDAAFLAWE
ncbi:MAG: dihydroorotate dehydrogenase electron transfer subunit [Planctomycetota bacterium]